MPRKRVFGDTARKEGAFGPVIRRPEPRAPMPPSSLLRRNTFDTAHGLRILGQGGLIQALFPRLSARLK